MKAAAKQLVSKREQLEVPEHEPASLQCQQKTPGWFL